jgi:hypothetical protein
MTTDPMAYGPELARLYDEFFAVMRQDLARLLEGAGLIPYRWLAGNTDGPITMETWHLVAICQKDKTAK